MITTDEALVIKAAIKATYSDPTMSYLCEKIDNLTKVHDGYTREELSAAFDRVKNPKHWKMPINTNLPKLSDAEKKVIRSAIVFYTGSVAKFTDFETDTCVQAAGYYVAIGA